MNKIKIFIKLFNTITTAKLISKKCPLFISWRITNRCNFKCSHCACWKRPGQELTYEEIRKIILFLKDQQTRFISFIGGEPIVREDIGEILQLCKRYNIITKITSNGSLIEKFPERIKDTNNLLLSLDGTQNIHDEMRIKNSFTKIMSAVKWAKENNINTAFNTIISRQLIEDFDNFYQMIKSLDIPTYFQPLESRYNATFGSIQSSQEFNSKDDNYTKSIMPSKQQMKEFSQKLLDLKKNHKGIIASSSSLIKMFAAYPTLHEINCCAGLLSFRILPNGEIVSCDRIEQNSINLKQLDDFNLKPFPHHKKCSGCWRNNTIELNKALNMNLQSALEIGRRFLR
jgi:MoaA/NifB/PqqE/SkfB family radical SAM enzyme